MKNTCPDEALPDIKPLGKMTPEYLHRMTTAIDRVQGNKWYIVPTFSNVTVYLAS